MVSSTPVLCAYDEVNLCETKHARPDAKIQPVGEADRVSRKLRQRSDLMTNEKAHSPKGLPVIRQTTSETDVVVVGAGIIGLANALQLAKRGLRVTLIDNLRDKKHSYKVGESFLVFTSAFLRTVGELDEFITEESFAKLGVWFSHGTENRSDFHDATEWAINADPHPPHYLYDLAPDKKWFRCMFLDMQIVRPEAEDSMCAAVRRRAGITFVDTARVSDIQISPGADWHQVEWLDGTTGHSNIIRTRWVVDCSGRNRLLARGRGHAAERRELTDGFQTTAVWGQFEGVTDGLFGDEWTHTFPNGRDTQRDLYTVHLWGAGYWIWVIRLSKERISVGATFDQRSAPPGRTPQEQFWNLIRRHPVLDKVIAPESLLEFRTYRNVQHWTDTFVSPQRYAMVGDAGSIIDAYYSQGIALALVTSWHLANIVQDDVRSGNLDRAYIERVNRATRQDWHMLRAMVREKYTAAIADPRFFVLSHVLDMMVFWSVGSTRSALTRWLVDTEGDTTRETPKNRRVRRRLQSTLFYSRAPLWRWLPPETVHWIQSRLQANLAARARWRLDHGVKLPTVRSVQNVTAPLPKLWWLAIGGDRGRDISAHDLVEPAELRPEGTATWLDRLPVPANTRLRWVIRLRPYALLAGFSAAYLWDGADTAIRRLRLLVRRPSDSATASELANHEALLRKNE
ncbi:NAD(P)/FAD-dependent oxidoreductase [Frankia sp. BMG5.23]|uniref:NAD(P)/FAD-dependent oxidoreductase n=1 Tax=Frankia sp. BMG5.23 TaxID=683305 RepID=UPI0019109610|nr:FAD-dependent oxidoreductase [Frankia sp. BMG5.23]